MHYTGGNDPEPVGSMRFQAEEDNRGGGGERDSPAGGATCAARQVEVGWRGTGIRALWSIGVAGSPSNWLSRSDIGGLRFVYNAVGHIGEENIEGRKWKEQIWC